MLDCAICVLEIESCCLPVRMDSLRDAPLPKLISFLTSPEGSTVPQWTEHATQMEVHAAMNRIKHAITIQAEKSKCLGIDALIHPLTMPTINGWILGYPVSYLVHSVDEAEKASRVLSTSTLQVYRAYSCLHTLGNQHLQDLPLLSFSLPESLLNQSFGEGDCESAWSTVYEDWKSRLAEAVAQSHCVWDPLHIQSNTTMTGVIL